ncbi:MAG: ATP synthase F1 subunit epsilon [Candidatus Abawacabacteria bacterium]|nr:ATP synthase F1 subunit epsilon [Candidatus Abawacabacteria bacterium]
MNLHILAIDETIYEGATTSISIPTEEGIMTVLPHHQPIVALLITGIVSIHTSQETKEFFIGGGFLEVKDDTVYILADTAENLAQTNQEQAELAYKQADEELSSVQTAEETMYAKGELMKSLTRLKIINRRKHREHRY